MRLSVRRNDWNGVHRRRFPKHVSYRPTLYQYLALPPYLYFMLPSFFTLNTHKVRTVCTSTKWIKRRGLAFDTKVPFRGGITIKTRVAGSKFQKLQFSGLDQLDFLTIRAIINFERWEVDEKFEWNTYKLGVKNSHGDIISDVGPQLQRSKSKFHHYGPLKIAFY